MSWGHPSHSTRGGGHRGSCSTRIGEAEARERCKVGRGFPRGGQTFLSDLYLDATQNCDRKGRFLEILGAEVVPGSQMCSAKRQEFVLVVKVTQILEEKKRALAAKQKTREAQPELDVLVGMCPIAQVINLFLLGNLVSFFDPDLLPSCEQLEQEERAKLKERTAAYEKDSLVPYDLMHLQCPCGIWSDGIIIHHSSRSVSFISRMQRRKEALLMFWCFGTFLLLKNFWGNGWEIRQLPSQLCPRSTPTVPPSWWSCAERPRWMATSSWSPRRGPGWTGGGFHPDPTVGTPQNLGGFLGRCFLLLWKGKIRFQKKMPGEVAVCGANCGHHQDEPQTQDLFGPWNKSRKHGLVAEVVMNESHETSQTRWSRKEHWSLVG